MEIAVEQVSPQHNQSRIFCYRSILTFAGPPFSERSDAQGDINKGEERYIWFVLRSRAPWRPYGDLEVEAKLGDDIAAVLLLKEDVALHL